MPTITPLAAPTSADALIWRILSLLSACRRHTRPEVRLRSLLRKRGMDLRPRLSFWLDLCRGAGLLSESAFQPTLAAADFLARSPAEQVAGLLAGWAAGAEYPPLQTRREALVRRLRQWGASNLDPARAPEWNRAFQRELDGLRALGLWGADGLTLFGAAAFTDQLPERAAPSAWRIEKEQLILPYPPDWTLAWELEAFLDPQPGPENGALIYSLARPALRRAAARGKSEDLARLIERGLLAPLPDDLRERIAGQASIRVHTGVVIEFDDPAELARLRKMRPVRKAPVRLLTPRHLLAQPEEAEEYLRRLGRAGLVDIAALPPPSGETQSNQPNPPGLSLNSAERAYLLRLLQMNGSGLLARHDPPPGLERKLAASLPGYLRGVIERQVETARQTAGPRLSILEESLPGAPEEALRKLLHNALRMQEPVTISYQKPGGQAETRRITPLSIEQRGARWYVVAFDHRRRANRVFRLDRMAIPEKHKKEEFDPAI